MRVRYRCSIAILRLLQSAKKRTVPINAREEPLLIAKMIIHLLRKFTLDYTFLSVLHQKLGEIVLKCHLSLKSC